MNYLANFNQTWLGYMLGRWRFRFGQIKGLVPFGAQ